VQRLISYASEPGSSVPAYLLIPKPALNSGEYAKRRIGFWKNDCDEARARVDRESAIVRKVVINLPAHHSNPKSFRVAFT
jgi:hypothetical protein